MSMLVNVHQISQIQLNSVAVCPSSVVALFASILTCDSTVTGTRAHTHTHTVHKICAIVITAIVVVVIVALAFTLHCPYDEPMAFDEVEANERKISAKGKVLAQKLRVVHTESAALVIVAIVVFVVFVVVVDHIINYSKRFVSGKDFPKCDFFFFSFRIFCCCFRRETTLRSDAQKRKAKKGRRRRTWEGVETRSREK